ncbi:hypothetical protein Tco_0630855 [Tanacetum coccineum]
MDLDHALRINPPTALIGTSTIDEKRVYNKWKRSNRMSLMIIKNSISIAIRGAIPDPENAKDGVREHTMLMMDMANKLKGMDMEISEEEERLKLKKLDVAHVATTNSKSRKGSWMGKG